MIPEVTTSQLDPANLAVTCKSREDAWATMRRFDAAGLSAGYPSLTSPYTVEVRATREQVIAALCSM